jgi:SAM-dependent methyltransferase
MSNPQAKVWNSSVGDAWVTHAEHFDLTLAPFGEAVMARLDLRAGSRVLDVGCGTGATTLRLAAMVTPSNVVGVDLSVPMLAAARQRAAAAAVEDVEFVEHDVESAPLATGAFDVAFSRFGVMFFTDPVRAFTHIRQSLVPGGQLGFVCFQHPTANPFIVVPTSAAAPHLSLPAPAGPTEPSPFSLADRMRTTAVLAEAGFVDVSMEPGPTEAVLGHTDDLRTLALRVLEQNPAISGALGSASAIDRDAAVDATVRALEPYWRDGRVALGASTWIVTATARLAVS